MAENLQYPSTKANASFEDMRAHKEMSAAFEVMQTQCTELAQHNRFLEESAQRSTESFAHTCHELRTPMNVIMGIVHVFNMTPLTEKQKTYLGTLTQSAEAMMKLINELSNKKNSQNDVLNSVFSEQSSLISEQQKNKKTVLLVEDHQANVLVASSLLKILNYEHDVALSGEEALCKIAERKYDAILMDVSMQDMDGYEATRQIREWEKNNSLKRTSIIAMTAHALAGDREKCLEQGMDDYISKPFNIRELEAKLEIHTHNADEYVQETRLLVATAS